MGAAQLALPLAFAPVPVRTHGLRAAHPHPLVSLGKRPSPAVLILPHDAGEGVALSRA